MSSWKICDNQNISVNNDLELTTFKIMKNVFYRYTKNIIFQAIINTWLFHECRLFLVILYHLWNLENIWDLLRRQLPRRQSQILTELLTKSCTCTIPNREQLLPEEMLCYRYMTVIRFLLAMTLNLRPSN